VNDPNTGLPWFFTLGLVLIGLIVVLMIVMIIRAYIRTKHVKAYVAQQGWTYRSRDRQLAKRWTGPPFENGHDRRCDEVIDGEYAGWRFNAFTYRYETGSGDDESTWSTVIVALLCETSMPDIDVAKEGRFGRLLGKVMNYDIQLESEEFNRAYTVRSDDRKLASAVLHPRLMQDLLVLPRFSWAFRNGDLLGFDNWNGKPEELTGQLDRQIAILRSVPDYVWQDRGGRPDQLANEVRW
jgi:hypothetical protein